MKQNYFYLDIKVLDCEIPQEYNVVNLGNRKLIPKLSSPPTLRKSVPPPPNKLFQISVYKFLQVQKAEHKNSFHKSIQDV